MLSLNEHIINALKKLEKELNYPIEVYYIAINGDWIFMYPLGTWAAYSYNIVTQRVFYTFEGIKDIEKIFENYYES